MNVEIEVFDPSGDSEISLGDYVFYHRGCAPEPMRRYRNPATDEYTLSCSCGLEIGFPNNEAASSQIVRAVVGGSPLPLPTGSFRSQVATSVKVVPRNAA